MSVLKRKFIDWLYKNTTFPNGCKHSNELVWMFKDNCPCCIANPIETLSNKEYHEKYPARNIIIIGCFKIYLCDYHLKELIEKIRKE